MALSVKMSLTRPILTSVHQEFTTRATEEFVEQCADGAVSIEVYGHKSQGFGNDISSLEYHEHVIDQSRSIMDRYVMA